MSFLIAFPLLLALVGAQVIPPGTTPFTAEGVFTGCWSTNGGLNTDTFITLFSALNPAALPDPATTLYLALPPDPTPTVVSQNPNSLLIQMGDVAQLSRAQLCNGFDALPFPGTLFTPQPGQQRYAGFYGSSMKVTGYQLLLPECTPPGIPGVVCDPTKATITVTSIDVIVTENLISGYLTPPTATAATAGALFSISNVPCKPIFYNFPITNPLAVSINAKVIDPFGFEVDPFTLPVQGSTLASGWFSQINGENLFYYYSATVLGGKRLPGQTMALAEARCTIEKVLRVIGGVSTGLATLPFPNQANLGTVTVTDPATGAVLATSVPVAQLDPLPTGAIVIKVPIAVCPRTITVVWNPPAGLTLPAGSQISITAAPFVR